MAIDPEEIIGYIDPEDPECLIPIQNFTGPNSIFNGQPVPEEWEVVRWKDITDDGWVVTV